MAYRILIVDDEPILTELLSTHLQDHGYKFSLGTGKLLLIPKYFSIREIDNQPLGGHDLFLDRKRY